jgi:hypothetical protein
MGGSQMVEAVTLVSEGIQVAGMSKPADVRIFAALVDVGEYTTKMRVPAFSKTMKMLGVEKEMRNPAVRCVSSPAQADPNHTCGIFGQYAVHRYHATEHRHPPNLSSVC